MTDQTDQPDTEPTDEQATRDRARETDPRFRTADGALITNGLAVWDYDLKPAVVWLDEYRISRQYWDGWFDVIGATGGTNIMNGERLATRHPFSKEVPPPFVDPRALDLLATQGRGGALVGTGAGRALPVIYAPRVPTDPKPWVDENHTRFTSTEVDTVAPA